MKALRLVDGVYAEEEIPLSSSPQPTNDGERKKCSRNEKRDTASSSCKAVDVNDTVQAG
jgi:hypothetical protein